MNKLILRVLPLFFFVTLPLIATPSIEWPEGWKEISAEQIPKTVVSYRVGPAKSEYPPTIVLATESYDSSLKDYLKWVKSDCSKNKHYRFSELGWVRTKSGKARLCQTYENSIWGKVKKLQIIHVSEGKASIVTAVALEEEFSIWYDLFLDCFESFQSS